jgi:hypothetical protein
MTEIKPTEERSLNFLEEIIEAVNKFDSDYHENIADELFEIKKDIIPDLRKFVYDKPYEFLFVNVDTQRYFKGWDEIKI